MARRARIVIPGIPHYIQQSGWNDGAVFLSREDGIHYRDILSASAASAGLQILSYSFLPNGIHMLVIPLHADSLRKGVGDTNRQYARHINKIRPSKTPLWADRFHSFPLQEKYVQQVVQLIEWLPVLEGEVKRPGQWHFSSARSRLNGDEMLVTPHPLLENIDWRKIEDRRPSYVQLEVVASHQSTGRPLGDAQFITSLERKLGKRLRPRKRGRRPDAPSLTRILKSATG